MKRFIICILIFGIIFTAIIGVLIVVIPHDRNAYCAAYTTKMQRVDTLSAPRIIFVGGSNIAFGLHSKMITDSLHKNIANTAVHAGIGLRFMLDDVERRLRPGDNVVIMPEFVQFTDNVFYGSMETLSQTFIFASGLEKYSLLTYEQLANVLGGLPRYLISNMRQRKRSAAFDYTAEGFNATGDEVSHYGADPQPISLAPSTDPISDDAIAYVKNWVGRNRDRGITVHLLPPMVIQSRIDIDHDFNTELACRLAAAGIPFEAPIDAFAMPDSLAFNTDYHLNEQGGRIATARIICHL